MMPRFNMPPISRLIVIVPAVLCFVSFILTTLALFAGHQQGFMEDYAIVRVNTSMIGRNILQNADKIKSGGKTDKNSNLLDLFQNQWQDAKGDAKDKAAKAVGNVVGDIADKLGVAGWYSLHIMNSCEGNYGHNATAQHFKLNVTKCTASSPAYRLNLTQVLDHEMSIGSLHINLAQIGSLQSVQSKIENINDVLSALFTLYVLGICFSGLAIFTAIPFYFFPQKKWPILLNISITSLAAFFIFLGSIILTAASVIGTSALNDAGARFSIVAEQGTKLFTISWIAAGLMTLVTFFWAADLLVLVLTNRRNRRRQMVEEGKLPY